ncbi:MAG: ATP-binding protein [Hyphomicrobiaceae bacterium]
MKWATDTIAGRTILFLLLGLGTILGLAHYLYQRAVEREVALGNIERLADRLLVLSGTITTVAPAMRDEAAHRLSGGPIELHWAREPLATAGGEIDSQTQALRDHLMSRVPDLASGGLIVGSSRSTDSDHNNPRNADDPHTTLLSMAMSDGTWLNVTLVKVSAGRPTSPSILLSAILGAAGVIAVSVLMSRWLTQPLEQLAAGARQLFQTSNNTDLPETGTREVRTLAAALNELQHRIGALMTARTQMLAAVSHDLRSPLTRLRLRCARVADAETRRSFESDLDEMEAMIDAVLDFLRTDKEAEPIQQVDLSAVLQTIVDNFADAGFDVEVVAPRNLVVHGRHLALKRALTNLVQNALRYGGCARIEATADRNGVRVVIRDDGPGIATDKLQAVFEPFYRLEGSRGRATGGHGLGLTVARSIARAHLGDVVLVNRCPHGLDAVVTLPASVFPGERLTT